MAPVKSLRRIAAMFVAEATALRLPSLFLRSSRKSSSIAIALAIQLIDPRFASPNPAATPDGHLHGTLEPLEPIFGLVPLCACT